MNNKTKFLSSSKDIKEELGKDTAQFLFFDKDGEKLEEETKQTVAKIVSRSSDKFFVRYYQGSIFDPIGTHSMRSDYKDSEFKQVSKSVFDLYFMYLKSKNPIYFTKAQRGFMNE